MAARIDPEDGRRYSGIERDRAVAAERITERAIEAHCRQGAVRVEADGPLLGDNGSEVHRRPNSVRRHAATPVAAAGPTAVGIDEPTRGALWNRHRWRQ